MTSLNNIFDPLHVALNNSNNVNWILKLNVFCIDNKHNLIIVINILFIYFINHLFLNLVEVS